MEEVRIDRRKFLGAAAGVAGAAALGTWSPWAESRPNGPNGPIVTRQTLGIQQFSIRDATTRVPSTDANAVKGYLGGPNFPEDPTDLGPLVPLPGGFQEVFAYLGSVGIGGFEFYDFAQNQFAVGDPHRNPSNKLIRQWLDDAGMKSFGAHSGGVNFTNPTNANLAGRHQIQLAHDLGHTLIGTAVDAVNNGALTTTRDAWLGAAETFNDLGELLLSEGIKLFFHPEGTWWQYFADPDHPELNNTNKLDFFAANTDPRLVNFQIDTYHMYANRGARPYPSDPSNNTLWDAEGFVKRNWKRLIGYHVKDANRILPNTPAPPAVPFTQTQTRPGFPLAGGVDGIYALEGHIGNGAASRAAAGYVPMGAGFDPGSSGPNGPNNPGGARPGPDPNVIGFRNFFTQVRSTRGRGFRYHIIESDSGPGPVHGGDV